MRNHWNKNLVQKYDSKKEIYRIDKRSEEIQTKDQLSGLYLVKKIMDAPENDKQAYKNEFWAVGRMKCCLCWSDEAIERVGDDWLCL